MAARPDEPEAAGQDQRGEGGSTLRFIAVFKLLKALLLIVAGCGVLGLLDPEWQRTIVDWLDLLALREGRRLTSEVASKAVELLGAATLEKLVMIAIGCFVYGGVFLVEAVGLWLRKRWAEYLTTIVTASLLPFEAMELVERLTVARAAVLVVNLAVLVYLVRRLVVNRPGRVKATKGA